MHALSLCSSSPYIDLAFVNNMSKNHTTSSGILGRNQINHTTLNTMCQNHGNAPWYYKFGAQKGIRDLGRTYCRNLLNKSLIQWRLT